MKGAQKLRTGLLILVAVVLGWWLRSLASPPLPSAPQAAESAYGDSTYTGLWTCSMHPQVQRTSAGQCPICGMDLIPTESGSRMEEEHGEHAPEAHIRLSAAARARARIRTTEAELRYVEVPVRMVGKLELDETRQATITAWVPGRLERLFVDFTGVQVEPGDHMVQLFSPKLYATQTELLQAAAADQTGRDASRVLDATRERLRQWGLESDQIEEIERRGTASDRMTINAPMGGIVVSKYLQQGSYVEEGTPIYTIADLSHLWLKLDAYESDLPWLRYGQHVEFTTEAYSDEVFTGTIAFIAPVLDNRTRTVKVRVNVDNSQGLLKPDMFAKATVRARIAGRGRVMEPDLAGKWICPMHPEVVRSEEGTCDICGMDLVTTESRGYLSAEGERPLVIPSSSVLITGERSVVYVELDSEDGFLYEGREVLLGPRAGDYYIVREGIEVGERVVTQGSFRLDSALQIQAKPSMMSRSNLFSGEDGGKNH
ncbi:MAG: efflux transporter periplasmic adaptor subunit [Planctomycetes bacterium]|jgi:Cu(I)/Ag(I) efflux system membrane fusion protein|nr:efflux transporter periplasmic adaptor subunit [Planctomycetota bacterium]